MQLPDWLNWRVMLLFGALGPPLGALALFAAMEMVAPELGSVPGQGRLALGFVLFAVPFSFLYGLVPALLTGLVAPLAWVLGSSILGSPLLNRALTGAAAGAAVTFSYGGLGFGLMDAFGDVLSLEGAGAISGAVCSVLALHPRVSPNKRRQRSCPKVSQ